MAVGPIVDDVADSFDVYWNSAAAYPLSVVAPRRSAKISLEEIAQLAETSYRNERERLQAYPFEWSDWQDHFESLTTSFTVGLGRYEYDQPIVYEARPEQFYRHFKEFVAQANEEIIISSPYFIPDEEFAAQLAGLSARGVRVVVLTNSLASNNHIIAHAGYKRWRKWLVQAGIELYESRADSAAIGYYTSPPSDPGFLGLHTKAAVVDGRWTFVGSPNVDPRSMILNTENGFFIDSPALAARVASLIERDTLPSNAWRVMLDEHGSLEWASASGTVTRQPSSGFMQRVIEFFINFMPIKNQA
jgi:putative cardiolipin synthase